jgi:hypothetical protein
LGEVDALGGLLLLLQAARDVATTPAARTRPKRVQALFCVTTSSVS